MAADFPTPGELKKKKKNEIIGWELYFNNKKNL